MRYRANKVGNWFLEGLFAVIWILDDCPGEDLCTAQSVGILLVSAASVKGRA